jgi:anthranilate synthase/aminodeoxychorismate synthase-like glutamine amidotransferase
MILLIDNYDSFTYNLYQLVASLYDDILVKRNDEISLEEIEALHPQAILLSPGPCSPNEAGICLELIAKFYDSIPILGVCLGHQSIVQALGGKVGYAKQLMHGKKKRMHVLKQEGIFEGLSNFDGARYHSLSALELPDCLECTAECEGEIMAVQHKVYPVYGVQFHPESVMSEHGEDIIKNFLKKARIEI